ncbi:MAG: hypothetical protein ABIT37_01670 [Luteolibacter sp.]
MLRNNFNPLYSKAEVEPSTGPGNSPAPTENNPEGEATETDPDADADPDSDAEPKTPAEPGETNAPAAAAPLSAFERGKLRALGSGALITRLEQAEGNLGIAQSEVTRLTAENVKLKADLAAAQKETPLKVAEAAKGKDEAVSKGVIAQLGKLGITEAAAPSQVAAENTPEGMLEHFQTLKGAEKTTYWRANSKALKAAEASRLAAKSK